MIKTNIPSIDELKRFIRSKGCTLWQSWDITDDDGLEAAATWLRGQMVDAHRFVRNEARTQRASAMAEYPGIVHNVTRYSGCSTRSSACS